MNGHELDAALDRHNQRTRRDRFAMAALTGFLANRDPYEKTNEIVAEYCAKQADALITELDKEQSRE